MWSRRPNIVLQRAGAHWAQRGLKGVHLRSINTKNCNWRIIDDDRAAIATSQREKQKITDEEHEWPSILRCISGELHNKSCERCRGFLGYQGQLLQIMAVKAEYGNLWVSPFSQRNNLSKHAQTDKIKRMADTCPVIQRFSPLKCRCRSWPQYNIHCIIINFRY